METRGDRTVNMEPLYREYEKLLSDHRKLRKQYRKLKVSSTELPKIIIDLMDGSDPGNIPQVELTDDEAEDFLSQPGYPVDTVSFHQAREVVVKKNDILLSKIATLNENIKVLLDLMDYCVGQKKRVKATQTSTDWQDMEDSNKSLLQDNKACQAVNFELQQEIAVLSEQKCQVEERERKAMQDNNVILEEVQELHTLLQRQKHQTNLNEARATALISSLTSELEEAQVIQSFDELLVLQLKEERDALREQVRLLQEQVLMGQSLPPVSVEPDLITAVESRIQQKLTVPGGIFKQQGKHSRHKKHIRSLENKLNQVTIKFDEILCGNMDYRKDIAHMLQQKDLGCKIKTNFNRQIASQQSMMEKLGSKCTLAFRQRSEAESRTLEVRKCIEVESNHFIKRQMQLKIVIDHDAKLHSFMERKLQEIIPLEDDEDYKKKSAEKQQQHQNAANMLEMYMQGHSTLVEVIGERDLRQISQVFMDKEQKNFTHIGYINELHNKRNIMKNRTNKLKGDILLLEQENEGRNEQTKSQLEDLESELQKNSHLADTLEQQCSVIQITLDQLRTAINVLFDEITHKSVTVTFDNIVHCISILEECISDLLIQANDVDDEQMQQPPHNLLLSNSDLLPGNSTKSTSRSLKSA
uniref:ODAD1 central coiled coil region domain-containing protein n=1 Tax=Dicentrarchus labrax TaxID=13489 RepID=A0A8P4KTG2_DICLA